MKLFISLFSVLLIFNFLYVLSNPNTTNTMFLGALVGMVSTVVAVGVISGVQILGSGLNGTSIQILFGITSLLNILFQINIAGFPIGLGLVNNVINVFPPEQMGGIGYIIASSIGIVILVTGILEIMGSGE